MERATWARRVVLLVGAAAAAAALIGGIISSRATAASPTPATSASAGAGKVVLKIGVMESLDSLNPFIGWTTISYELFYLDYLKLVGSDTETGQPTPGQGVAESWELSPDGLTWTFHLNEGLTWHDGEPVTAEDVAFTINYIIDNEMSAFTLATQYIEKAVVVDPYTVQIICTQPKANLLGVTLWVFPEHIWSKISPEDAATRFENPPPVIGDGPFQVVEWKRNEYIRLVANKDFHNGSVGPAKIDELLFVQYQNADTMVQDLKAGNLDAAYPIPPAQFESLENTPGVAVAKYPQFNWAYLAFNCYTGKSRGNPVLRDQRFRVALEYAIDRERIVDVAYQGYAIPGYTFLPPGNWKDPDYSWQPPDGVRRDFDLAKANQLLDEAGYKMGPDGIRLDKRGKPIVLAPVVGHALCGRSKPPPSSSPAGSARSAWAPRCRSWTKASTTTPSGTTRATPSCPTSTCTFGPGRAMTTSARTSPPSRPRRSRTTTSSPGRTRSSTASTRCR